MAKKPTGPRKKAQTLKDVAARADAPPPADDVNVEEAPPAQDILPPPAKPVEEDWDNRRCGACHQLLPLPADPTGGRPTTYSPVLVDRILELLSQGNALKTICAAQPDMPAPATFLGWVRADREGLYDRYARARDIGLDVMADDMLVIADAATGDDAHARRLQTDTRKWLLSKLKPGTYGDRLDLNVSGQIDVNRLTDEQLNASLEEILIQAGVPEEVMALVRPYITVIPLPTRPALKALPGTG